MKYMITLAALSVLFLTGCSTEEVLVVDGKGSPVKDAEVYAVSLSMSTGPVKTNAKGEATVPSNAQGAKWVSVTKKGYQDVQVDVPTKWPLKITLKKK